MILQAGIFILFGGFVGSGSHSYGPYDSLQECEIARTALVHTVEAMEASSGSSGPEYVLSQCQEVEIGYDEVFMPSSDAFDPKPQTGGGW